MLRATSLTLLASLLLAASAEERPCDILAAAGNPCVAAHSTVRALYALYAGPLYRVTRPTSPTTNVSANISVLGPGGFADIAAHERFCAKRDCVIANIFDQSPQHNHLNQRISDGVVHKMVNASKHKISVAGGVEVFGMMFDPGHGYHVDYTTGVAKGNDPESIYAVMSGKNYNGKCCFDCKNDHGGGGGYGGIVAPLFAFFVPAPSFTASTVRTTFSATLRPLCIFPNLESCFRSAHNSSS